MDEGGHVYACRFSAAALYGMREIDMMEGVEPINPLDVLDAVLTARRDGRADHADLDGLTRADRVELSKGLEMAATDRVTGHVIDAHSHIGELAAWKFYNLAEPVKPTVYDFADDHDYLEGTSTGAVSNGR